MKPDSAKNGQTTIRSRLSMDYAELDLNWAPQTNASECDRFPPLHSPTLAVERIEKTDI